MSSSCLYGLFLLWFVRMSRQNTFCWALSWRSIVYLCIWGWLDDFTTSHGFVCLSLFSHQRPDIIAFQLQLPSLLLAKVLCGVQVYIYINLLCMYVEDSHRYTDHLPD